MGMIALSRRKFPCSKVSGKQSRPSNTQPRPTGKEDLTLLYNRKRRKVTPFDDKNPKVRLFEWQDDVPLKTVITKSAEPSGVQANVQSQSSPASPSAPEMLSEIKQAAKELKDLPHGHGKDLIQSRLKDAEARLKDAEAQLTLLKMVQQLMK